MMEKWNKKKGHDWPCQSPELNQMEMLCHDLKRTVHAWKPSSVAGLKQFFHDVKDSSQLLDLSCCCQGWHNQLLDLGHNLTSYCRTLQLCLKILTWWRCTCRQSCPLCGAAVPRTTSVTQVRSASPLLETFISLYLFFFFSGSNSVCEINILPISGSAFKKLVNPRI